MALNGSQIIARVLKRMGVDDFSISWVTQCCWSNPNTLIKVCGRPMFATKMQRP